MAKAKKREPGTYLWRGGERLDIRKIPDRFTARLRPRTVADTLARETLTTHSQTLRRQKLEEFTVDESNLDAAMEEVRQRDDVDFASHVYGLEDDPSSRFYLTDQITVQFEPDVSDSEIESLTVDLGLVFVKEVPGLQRTYVFRVTAQAKKNPIKIANHLQESNKVLVSEPNIVVRMQSQYVPSDALFSDQWHLHHDGGISLATDSHVHAMQAWDLERGQRSVVVAVADDSVDMNHPDFQGEGKIVAPVDFADADFEPLPGTADDNHGTACAGVAVAEENGSGVVGVAPGCALMPIRTSSEIDDDTIEALFDWIIDNGASVVSCSWSATDHYYRLSLRQHNAIHRAATLGRDGRGCVIVFAAANNNRPLNGTVDEHGWPNDWPSGATHWLNGFATHEDVIAVAANTSLGRKAAYSSWGAEVSVCAPSNNAGPRTYPRITAWLPGLGVVTTDRGGSSGYSLTDYTYSFGGTSSSCPLVAGVAALVLSANPYLTAREVREILETTADKIEDLDPDPQLGQSLGTYDADGHSQWFGYGKVNAFAAVTEALARAAEEPQEWVRKVSAPALRIPDNKEAGVSDNMRFAEQGSVVSLRVRVDLTHTYIGDLRLSLTAPNGESAVLHDRNGGSADDIRHTYDLTTSPALRNLVGSPIRGDWVLRVQDLAHADTGTLNEWELEVEGRAETTIEREEAPGVTIPDNDPTGIERTLTINADGQVRDVGISVDITHTYIRDLVVTLVSPAGTSIDLHRRTGGSADNIITTYTVGTTAGLQVLPGELVGGDWKLRVADLEGVDVGKLNRWGLRVLLMT